MTAALWTTIGVSFLGVVGTLAAALLTQRQANRLETRRWEYESAKDAAADARQREGDHDRWLRDKRHEIYGDLIRESSKFASNLLPLIDMSDRIFDPESDLYQIRHRYFELQYRASFLAGEEMQRTIRQASDITEDCGHAPYDENNALEKSEFESRMVKEAFMISRALEVCARAELNLPARRQLEKE